MHLKRTTKRRSFWLFYAQSALSIAEFNLIFPRSRPKSGTGILACLPMWANEIVVDFFCASIIPGIDFAFRFCLDKNFLINSEKGFFCKNRVWFQFLAYLSTFKSGNQEITGTGETTRQLKSLEKKRIGCPICYRVSNKILINFPMLWMKFL